MPQNNYNDIMEALRNSLKNYTTEDFVKKQHLMANASEQFCTTLENDLGFSPIKQVKDKIISDEHKSN